MSSQETKHDLFLKRLNLVLAILGSAVALAVGVYNLKKNYFEKPAPPPPPVQATPVVSDKIKSALEDVGASWIESLKKKAD